MYGGPSLPIKKKKLKKKKKEKKKMKKYFSEKNPTTWPMSAKSDT